MTRRTTRCIGLASIVMVCLLKVFIQPATAADGPTSVEAQLKANKGVGVGFDQLADGQSTLTITLRAPDAPPTDMSISKSKPFDATGEHLWKPEAPQQWTQQNPITEINQVSKTHEYKITGVVPGVGDSVRFHGELVSAGAGSGNNGKTRFMAAVADLDLRVDSHYPPRHDADHWKPYGDTSQDGLDEDQSEDGPGGGMFLTCLYDDTDFPLTVDKDDTSSPYKIMKVTLRTSWPSTSTVSTLGQITFDISGPGVAIYQFSESGGTSIKRITSADQGTARTISVTPAGLPNDTFAILTNNNFTEEQTIVATFEWDSSIKGSDYKTAVDSVRLVPIHAEIVNVRDKDGTPRYDPIFDVHFDLDVKTDIDGTSAPAKICCEVVGPPANYPWAVNQADIAINCTPNDDIFSDNSHIHFYEGRIHPTGDPVWKRLDSDLEFDTLTGEYRTGWDGRDTGTGDNRLLLAGKYAISATLLSEGLELVTPATQPFTQNIAQPHAGHFCGDWPRASVYNIGDLTNTKINYGMTDPPDEDTTDNIRPMRKNCFDASVDGGWWYSTITFYYKANYLGRWIAYTDAFDPSQTKKGKPNPANTAVVSISSVYPNTGDVANRYPNNGVRRGIRAKWIASSINKWQMYWADNPFDTGTWQPFQTTSGGSTQPIYLDKNGSVSLAFNGTLDNDGNQLHDFVVTSQLGIGVPDPAADAETVLFLLPRADDQDHYNSDGTTKNLVKVDLSGLTKTEGAQHQVLCHRGFPSGVRKFWDVTVAGEPCGVNARANVTSTAGYNSDFELNKTAAYAIDKWTSRDAFIDYDGHSGKGFIGWYWRVRPSPGDGDSFGELFDMSHNMFIQVAPRNDPNYIAPPSNMDDVQLAVLCGCHNAEGTGNHVSPKQAMKDAGVDVVLAWNGTTNTNHSLFAKLFLTLAYQKTNTLYTPQWTDYPSVENAREAAIEWLRVLTSSTIADSVDSNLVIAGAQSETAAKNTILYPPRYGAKDK